MSLLLPQSAISSIQSSVVQAAARVRKANLACVSTSSVMPAEIGLTECIVSLERSSWANEVQGKTDPTLLP